MTGDRVDEQGEGQAGQGDSQVLGSGKLPLHKGKQQKKAKRKEKSATQAKENPPTSEKGGWQVPLHGDTADL
eukprot:12925683-Prorocentrum_lima.AAC.1